MSDENEKFKYLDKVLKILEDEINRMGDIADDLGIERQQKRKASGYTEAFERTSKESFYFISSLTLIHLRRKIKATLRGWQDFEAAERIKDRGKARIFKGNIDWPRFGRRGEKDE